MTKPYHQLADVELMQLIVAGEQSALMALYHRHAGAVYSLALQVLGQPHLAEEVTQDVFLKVWQRGEKWDASQGRFISWLLTVTRNTAIDRRRREARRPPRAPIPLDTVLSLLGNPTQGAEISWEDGQLLRSLLEKLPPAQRTVIVLAYYGGMSHSELAEQLDLPLGTVKTRLRLGMAKLKNLWEEATSSPHPEESPVEDETNRPD